MKNKIASSTVWLAFFAVVFAIVARPFVMMNLWEWFVCPLGLPQIGYWHAFGLLLILTRTDTGKKSSDYSDSEVVDLCVKAIVAPIAFWCFGAAAHAFMN